MSILGSIADFVGFLLSSFITPQAYVGLVAGVIFSPAIRRLPILARIVNAVEGFVNEYLGPIVKKL